MFQRPFIAAALAAVLLALAPVAAQATLDKKQSEDDDRHSRHEDGSLSSVPLPDAIGGSRIGRLVVIQTRFIHIAETSFGVDFRSYDRIDVSDVPLLGSLFGGDRLSAEDFTEENRVGSVYSAGDGSLAAVIDDSIEVSDLDLEVVTGPGTYQIQVRPRLIDVAPLDLGEFGGLPSVGTLIAGQASTDTTVVLGGLTKTEVPEVDSKVPHLGDIPMLQKLFRGTAHRGEENKLFILLRPSIVMGDEDS